jgi:hypothetical protein
MSKTNVFLFKQSPKLYKTQVEFVYDSKNYYITIYESSKLETLFEKILLETSLEKSDLKFINNDTTIIPEIYYALFPVKLLITGTLQKIILKNEEYQVQVTRDISNRAENDLKTTFIEINEQDECRLEMSKVWKSSATNSTSEEKVHVVSVFGSTHSGKSRIIQELLLDKKYFENNGALPFVGSEDELSSTTSDIHIYERNTKENEIRKIIFLDVEGMGI